MPDLTSLFGLAGRTALITGASRGIGFAIAETLAAAGARVILNGRNADTLEERRRELVGRGYPAGTAVFDVTDPEASIAAVRAIGERHGGLHILVSNAGATVRKPLLEQTEEDWQSVIAADLSAGWRLAREAARLMVPAGGGRMVFVSSIMDRVARPGITAYVAAKAGLDGLVRALAIDLAPSSITVNALAPGYFPTEGNSGLRLQDPAFEARISARTPMGRWGRLDEIGAAALYLASPAAGYTTGSVLTVDGGLTASL